MFGSSGYTKTLRLPRLDVPLLELSSWIAAYYADSLRCESLEFKHADPCVLGDDIPVEESEGELAWR
jgi:hypothetical protein